MGLRGLWGESFFCDCTATLLRQTSVDFQNYILPKRKEWTEEQLRPPSRPVAKGARQDEGFPNWPFSASRAWTLFTDDLKVIRHGVEEGFGEGAEIFHALNHEGTNAHLMARKVLKDLQVQGSQEVPLRRYQQNKSSRRRKFPSLYLDYQKQI